MSGPHRYTVFNWVQKKVEILRFYAILFWILAKNHVSQKRGFYADFVVIFLVFNILMMHDFWVTRIFSGTKNRLTQGLTVQRVPHLRGFHYHGSHYRNFCLMYVQVGDFRVSRGGGPWSGKMWAKSVQLVRVSFFLSDFLQNPYFSGTVGPPAPTNAKIPHLRIHKTKIAVVGSVVVKIA